MLGYLDYGSVYMAEKVSQEVMDHLLDFYNENPFVEKLMIKVDTVEMGRVVLWMDVEYLHINYYHIAHGGALMSLADTSMGATCLSCNKKVVTQSFSMNFVKAAPMGKRVIAVGRVLHNGSRTMTCETELINEEGQLLCKASGSFFVIGTFTE